MTDAPYSRLAAISGLLSITVPISVFVALQKLRGPKNVFQSIVIGCQIPEDCDQQMAEVRRRAQSGLTRHSHNEMIGLTVLALTILLFCFLFTRNGVPKWTKYLLITSVVATLASCWLQW